MHCPARLRRSQTAATTAAQVLERAVSESVSGCRVPNSRFAGKQTNGGRRIQVSTGSNSMSASRRLAVAGRLKLRAQPIHTKSKSVKPSQGPGRNVPGAVSQAGQTQTGKSSFRVGPEETFRSAKHAQSQSNLIKPPHSLVRPILLRAVPQTNVSLSFATLGLGAQSVRDQTNGTQSSHGRAGGVFTKRPYTPIYFYGSGAGSIPEKTQLSATSAALVAAHCSQAPAPTP